ncbi:hypothetical protein LZ198_06170 [Myxococcus sp. K15C18031901]|uniref:hypothetical protein n=1 Tax=Myxococcus dinghuensis TaxID=2906761 RepID=UPI0020A76108|nr:hypothetical protein [Myxococcus dinghuensis]MCP3098462.1 hypothetical protein [Myxococcus dinghuensis]
MTSLPRAVLVAVVAMCSSACGDDEDCEERSIFARPSAGGDCRTLTATCGVPDGFVECCGGLALARCDASGPEADCVDDPLDTCLPGRGADCPGICQ